MDIFLQTQYKIISATLPDDANIGNSFPYMRHKFFPIILLQLFFFKTQISAEWWCDCNFFFQIRLSVKLTVKKTFKYNFIYVCTYIVYTFENFQSRDFFWSVRKINVHVHRTILSRPSISFWTSFWLYDRSVFPECFSQKST